MIEDQVPGYIGEGKKEEKWRKIARFRMENKIRKGKYWLRKKERLCRICGEEEERWEHWKDTRRR